MDTIGRSSVREIANSVKGAQILVVGDLMLDEYVWGDVERISPEAPVPVVNVRSESIRLGGASNVVQNLKRLGADPVQVSVCGRDSAGERYMGMLSDMGCRCEGILRSEARVTTLKTRIMAGKQYQIVRVDRERIDDLSTEERENLQEFFDSEIDRSKGVIVSDYGKGVVTEELLSHIIGRCREKGVLVSVDPKVRHFSLYKGVDTMTPNIKEAFKGLEQEYRSDISMKEIEDMGWKLLDRLGIKSLVITLGRQGMAVFERSQGEWLQMPTFAREVFDVTGAGDTVISTLTAVLSTGASLKDAAFIANHAAGLAEGEVGTATIGFDDIIESLESTENAGL